MTRDDRRQRARQLRDELQPTVARLFRNFEATIGRELSDEELADYQLAADLLDEIGEGLQRLSR